MTNHPPLVLWYCWLGHQTCKNCRPYNLYCVGADVKPCSINQLCGTAKTSAYENKNPPGWNHDNEKPGQSKKKTLERKANKMKRNTKKHLPYYPLTPTVAIWVQL